MASLRRRWKLWVLAAVAVVGMGALAPVAEARLRAAALLLRFSGQSTPSYLAPFSTAVEESDLMVVGDDGAPIAARVYRPVGKAQAPGLVVLHGVHRLGIHDPRLIAFARAMSQAGVVVLTPEIRSLTEYRVDADGVAVIGAAARALGKLPGVSGGRVGVVGMSFAGGLALMAAADPRYASQIGLVVAVGAHDDLARVSRFFATGEIAAPDGAEKALTAHEYGALVLAHAHPEALFAPADAPVASEILRRWLWEEHDAARAQLGHLSPAGRERMEALLGERARVKPALLACVDAHAVEMARSSPHGHLEGLQADVFLLHGSGDTVIPPTESLWLAQDLPPGRLRGLLITPLLEHVTLEKGAPEVDMLQLVNFLGEVLADADHGGRG